MKLARIFTVLFFLLLPLTGDRIQDGFSWFEQKIPNTTLSSNFSKVKSPILLKARKMTGTNLPSKLLASGKKSTQQVVSWLTSIASRTGEPLPSKQDAPETRKEMNAKN